MKYTLSILLLLTHLFSQSLTLAGVVVDQKTGLPLIDANVSFYIEDGMSMSGTSTDNLGNFFADNLPEGVKKVEVSVIGYTTLSISVDGTMQTLRFQLQRKSIALEEIEVYSTFRKVNEGDLASSARIFSNELKIREGQHFADIIQNVPNLNYAGGSSRPRYFQIRGEGSTSRYADQGPPSTYVGLVLDGMDLSELGVITPLFDMQQIEVLMGVQTSMFGANASSGLINFKTNDPTDKQEGYVFTQYGSHNSITNGIVYNFALPKDWRIRLVGHKHLSDGYKENQYASSMLSDDFTSNKNESSMRLKALNQTNRLTQKYTLIYSDFNNGYDEWSPDNNENNKTYTDNPGKDSQESKILIADYAYDLNEFDLSVNVGMSDNTTLHSYDSDWGNNTFWGSDPYNWDASVQGYSYDFFDSFTRDIDTQSFDMRLNSNERFNDNYGFVVGLFSSSYQEDTNAVGYLYGGSATTLSSGFDIDTFSIYGEASYDLNDNSSFSLALRSEDRSVQYADLNDPIHSFKDEPNPNISYKVSFEQHPISNLHWFAYYAAGYHPGGINQNPYLDSDERTYEKESYTDITVGIRWFNDNIKFSGSLFFLTHDDHIFETNEQLDTTNPNAFAFFKTNAESGAEYGLESSGEFKINDSISLTTSLGLLSSEVTFGDHEEEAHEDDHEEYEHGEKAHAPNWNYSFGFNYNFNLAKKLMVEVSGKDGFIYDASNDGYESDPYHLLHAYYSQSFDRFDLKVYAKNILDESYAVRGFIFGLEPPTYATKLYKAYGPPREVGISLTYSL